MKGKHLILDIHNIQDKELLYYTDTSNKLLNLIVDAGKLNVVGILQHQFNPIGCTIIYLLAESHLSIHTYPEMCYCAIDLYCCNDNIDFKPIIELIDKFFNFKCWIKSNDIIRA